MIKTKEDLKKCLEIEKNIYFGKSLKEKFELWFTSDAQYYIGKFIVALRKTEYYHNNRKMIRYLIYRRKKNRLGLKLGMKIWDGVFEPGLKVYHSSGIVINGMAKVGKNCSLHGNNCIGNNGFSDDAPVIGNNVDIGVGASIIGKVEIADDIVIGAGAVVTKSFKEKGITIAGVPAVRIK